MKNILIIISIFLSINTYSQNLIKIKKSIFPYIKSWPDTNSSTGTMYSEQNNGILFTVPNLENEKRIKITEYFIEEKFGNALIIKDSIVKNVFWIYPNQNQKEIILQLWVKLNKNNIYYPVALNNKKVFDESGKVISQNVRWELITKTTEYKNKRLLISSLNFKVKMKPKKLLKN